uniref:Uncharacterized protein n=1 Tax=Arundo donax TaxID=35708 RepID=A0A0A9CR32_ARUDO
MIYLLTMTTMRYQKKIWPGSNRNWQKQLGTSLVLMNQQMYCTDLETLVMMRK